MIDSQSLMLRRTLDATFLNRVANHVSVRDSVGVAEDAVLDFTSTCMDARNVTLISQHGGFIFVQQEPGYYELHTLFEPRGQGRERRDASILAARYMFLRTDAQELVTRVPVERIPGADLAVRQFGFRPTWRAGDGQQRYSLTMQDWAIKDAMCLAKGRDFHQSLESAKHAVGSERVAHPDDATHDGIVGAAYACVLEGQVLKGVNFYNKWARLAGYEPIIMLSAWPPIIDVHDAIVTTTDGAMDMVLVR